MGSSSVKKRGSPHSVRVEEDIVPENEDDSDDEVFSGITFEKQGVCIGAIRPKMHDIMWKIQQKGLKRMIKAWLSKCHPQKQAKFPYNGGKIQEDKKKRGDPTYDACNPGLRTAPDYWPPQENWLSEHGRESTGVRHKEPDHLLRPGKDPLGILLLLKLLIDLLERLILGMHLLHAGDRYDHAKFNIDKMEASTLNLEKEFPKDFPSDARMLIDSLYYARRKEIEYENDEIGKLTVVNLRCSSVLTVV